MANYYNVEWQMERHNISKKEAEQKIAGIRKKRSDIAKQNNKNRLDVNWQMERYSITREEAEAKISKMKGQFSKAANDRNSVEWQMKKHSITEQEAIAKLQASYDKGIETVNNLPEFDKKAISANNKEHWIKKGFSEEEAIQKAWDHCANMRDKYKEKLADNIEVYADRLNTRIEYWLKQTNGDLLKATALYKERQATNTLAAYIEKYGDAGYDKWKKRNTEWSVLMEEKFVNGEFSRESISTSDMEREFCGLLKNELQKIQIECETQFILNKPGGSYYLCDMLVSDNIVVEFNGDFWHANPLTYESEWINPLSNKTATEIWENDVKKQRVAEDAGYKYIIVWENDYIADTTETVMDTVKQIKELLHGK